MSLMVSCSVDPVAAIRQHCDMLLQQGHTQEVDQLTQEILMKRSQQFTNVKKPGEGNRK